MNTLVNVQVLMFEAKLRAITLSGSCCCSNVYPAIMLSQVRGTFIRAKFTGAAYGLLHQVACHMCYNLMNAWHFRYI